MNNIWIDAKEGDNAHICVVFVNGIPFKKRIGKATRVQAKFTALIEALNMLQQDGRTKAIIYTDERYIVRQMTMPVSVNKNIPSHVNLRNRAMSLYKNMRNCRIMFLPTTEIKKHTSANM